jgi:transcriptional regulator with XRE-family HTH domain
MGFGNVLKSLREKAGLSQTELAERVRLSVRSIQNWEQGHRIPRAQVLLSLARGIGVPVEKLLAEIGEPGQSSDQDKPGKGKKA